MNNYQISSKILSIVFFTLKRKSLATRCNFVYCVQYISKKINKKFITLYYTRMCKNVRNENKSQPHFKKKFKFQKVLDFNHVPE